MNYVRQKIVAANWKMNTSVPEGESLLNLIIQGLPLDLNCSVIIAPPFTHLSMARTRSNGTPIHVGAQNCHQEKSGAFTGEISVEMLKSLDVEYVIVGHSERRQIFKESNEIIKNKVNAVLEATLIPIFCCGEPLDIRRNEGQNNYVKQQLEESLFHLGQNIFENVIIAYEPIWAIGTGVVASPEQAQQMHYFIREQIAKRYNKMTSEKTRILYGGSIKPDNAHILFSQTDVDGGLVGGASLNVSGFIDIINRAC